MCEACGHVFDITVQSKVYEKFNDELLKLQKKVFDDLELPDCILTYISNYPVPNNRTDLIEFLINLQGLANPKGPKDGWTRDGNHLDFSYYYWVLFTNCINKAKVYFSSDKDFQASFEYHKEKSKEKRRLFSKLFG